MCTHDFSSKPLQAGVLDFIESVLVVDGEKGVVVSDDREVWEPSQEEVTFRDSPCYC